MVKLLENTFRATNVALVNEIAIMCDRLGIDVWEVIDAAGTKPFGFMSFYPGPGLGGHCIPVDPHLLAWKLKTLDYHARFIHLAEEINLGMPLYWVTKVQDALNQIGKAVNGSNVLVLGVTYKPDVADIRESPAVDIIDELRRRGALVSYHDARVPVLETETFRLTSLGNADLDKGLSEADCIVIATDHSTYDWEAVRRQASLVVDTRNALGNLPSEPAAAPMAASDD
jgi:UDP-N-acetyl-D-glucosamine dehydrogenase